MGWKVVDISEKIKDEDWKNEGIKMYTLLGNENDPDSQLAILALELDSCAVFQVDFPLDEQGVMDAFFAFHDELKLDNVPCFTSNKTTEDDTHRLVKCVTNYPEDVPDTTLGRFVSS